MTGENRPVTVGDVLRAVGAELQDRMTTRQALLARLTVLLRSPVAQRRIPDAEDFLPGLMATATTGTDDNLDGAAAVVGELERFCARLEKETTT